MMSHDLAKKLLELPNLPMQSGYDEVKLSVQEEVDYRHKDYQPFQEIKGEPWKETAGRYAEYWEKMPKIKVIGFNEC